MPNVQLRCTHFHRPQRRRSGKGSLFALKSSGSELLSPVAALATIDTLGFRRTDEQKCIPVGAKSTNARLCYPLTNKPSLLGSRARKCP
jgi:hypothetical protein